MRGRLGELADQFDDAVDEAWEALRGRPLLDHVFYTASELADFSLLWHVIGTGRAVADPGEDKSAARLSVALGIESLLVNGVIKSLFRRQRPVAAAPRPLRLRTPKTTSFPSGHASSAFMAATLLADRHEKHAGGYYALAALVATSRIHVKIHHASDVLGGAALGIALGQLTKKVWPLR